MIKEKTPIEELINGLEASMSLLTDDVILGTIDIVIQNIKLHLPKEREAIEEAYNSGGFDTINFCDDSKQYYNDKYGK